MLSQIQPLKPPEKVNSWGTPFQTTCSLIPSLSQHGPAAWSRAVRATFPLWAPPRKGKLPCNGLVCLAGIWCHHCPRDEARAAQLCVTGCLYPSDNGTALFTSWVRGLWSKEAVSHSCWLGLRGSQEWSEITRATTSITVAVQAAGCSRLNSLSVLCTICKCLLNDIWCFLTKNIA